MILKPYVIDLLTKNNKVRYGLATLLALTLCGVIAYDRLSKSERIKAEKTFDCPALDQGCQIDLRNFSYLIKTDRPIRTGMPFVLHVDGGGVEMRASWRMKDGDVDPNYYHLKSDGLDRWMVQMSLPAVQKMGTDWILHMEINARAVDITTLVQAQ